MMLSLSTLNAMLHKAMVKNPRSVLVRFWQKRKLDNYTVHIAILLAKDLPKYPIKVFVENGEVIIDIQQALTGTARYFARSDIINVLRHDLKTNPKKHPKRLPMIRYRVMGERA
jgi:hypothetical protein